MTSAHSSLLGACWFLCALGTPVVGERPNDLRISMVNGGPNNSNPVDSLCLDLRGVRDGNAVGSCQADDSECPGSGLLCVDDDQDPFNGGICVDRACYVSGDEVVVDVELGPTSEPACGAQLFLEWDTTAMDFVALEADPDLEFGASPPIINLVDEQAGTIDLVLSLVTALPCDALNASSRGGTLARLIFVATAECQDSDGVRLRPHSPSTQVGGAGGALSIIGCNGDTEPSGTDATSMATPPVWDCPESSSGNAACRTIIREVELVPIQVTDGCGGTPPDISELCTVTYHLGCGEDLDCGRGSLCSGPVDCDGEVCVTHADADGFICPGGVPCVGFCREAECIGGICDEPVDPVGVDLDALLDGGGSFLPGLTEIVCSYTNDCGLTSGCEIAIENTGLNTLIVEVESSPTMLPGFPNDPIDRCFEFELSRCDGGTEPIILAQEVRLGAPFELAGHGIAILDVPPGDWLCVSATDPKHTLTTRCGLECATDGNFYADLTGFPGGNLECHWMVQGNLNGDDVIDIFDYTILAGLFLTAPGEDSPCDWDGFHADINGDGLVTLADFAFPLSNFFVTSMGACGLDCSSPAAAQAPSKRRLQATVRELTSMGLGEYAEWADANGDGTVDLKDVTLFLDTYADEDPALAAELKNVVRRHSVGARMR